ncbi:MAG: hypothetical protein WAQ53_09255 [Thiofilum sp.]|uniref:hypothetical protein n=1 Tax=Thiofilum sp. TaxID=2212733 RepID=UPI0025E30F14|nr:hypothetical protein [Thiofilum sp.]MBK8451894.1 hypothetical protein [Thiofilum sp.]
MLRKSTILNLITGDFLNQLTIILSFPILIILYTPQDIGYCGEFLSYLSLLSILVTLGYDLAIINPDKNKSFIYFQASIQFSLINSLIVSLIFLIFFNELDFFSDNMLILSAWVYSIIFLIGLIFTSLYSPIRYFYLTNNKANDVSQATIHHSLIRVFVLIGVYYTNLGWIGIVLSEIISKGYFVIFLFLRRGNITKNTSFKNQSIIEIFKKNYQYPFFVMPSSFIDTFATLAPLFFITYLYKTHEYTGLFFLATKIIYTPINLLSKSFSDIFHIAISSYMKESEKKIISFFHSSFIKILLISLLIYLPLGSLAVITIPIFVSDMWKDLGLLIFILIPIALGKALTSILGRAILISKKRSIKFIVDLTRLVLPLTSLYLGHTLELSFFENLTLFSLTVLIADLFYIVVVRYSLNYLDL